MCVSGTLEHGHEHDNGSRATSMGAPGGDPITAADAHPEAAGSAPAMDRRGLLRSGVALAGGAMFASMASAPPAAAAGRERGRHRTVDLTYRLVKDFPSFYGTQPVIVDEVIDDFDTTGFYSKQWTFPEHIGTHMDAPGHFAQGARLVDDLTADELVAPLVVVDIRRKANENPNAMVEPEDLVAYERRHGRIRRGALVAMDSGWEERYGDPDTFLGGSGFPDLNFPGFSVDATDWLVAKRDPVGIGVDTPSLDPGDSSTFDVHFGFLGTNRYGIENLANLGNAPARNATVFVGAVPWEDGSGGPCRVIATR